MKHRYLLDSENLIFQKEEKSFKQRIRVVCKYLISGGGLALIVWVLFYSGIIDSPERHYLHKINDNLISEVNLVNTEFDQISARLSHVQKRDDGFYRVISEINPIPHSIRQAGFGGVDKYHYLDGFENSDLLIESERKGDILLNQLYIQSKSYDTVIYLAQNREDSLLSVPGIVPVTPGEYRISDPFGMRIHPITGKLQKHTGIDFAARVGKSIYASGNGVVVDVRKSNKGYGNKVTISHGYGYKTLYAHMSSIYVKKGDKIIRGQIIGTVGNTGSSTGPHLHYEVIYNRRKINPNAYYINDLTDAEYKEMVKVLTSNI